MFNDETFSEQVTLSDLMIDRKEEEDNVAVSEQFFEPVNSSKQNTGLEVQVMRPLLLNLENQENNPQINENLGESKQIQLSVDIQQQSGSTLVEEDSI